MKKDVDSRLFNVINIIVLSLFTIIIVIPLWNVLISSFASGQALAKGSFVFWPDELSLENYKVVFRDSSMIRAFVISISKTVIGVVTHVFFCAMMAYAMSKANLKGRKLYSAMGITTMFFSGGMIPMYLLIRELGMLNSFWVYIIPALLSYYDVIILMNFFRSVPASLEESAMIDGAGHWKIFLRIFLPLSKPALATIALFNGVNQWNDFMTARIYITDKSLYPLQMKLYEIIVQSQTQGMQNIGTAVAQSTTKGVQLATIVVTTIPILLIYPLLQKHFISGMMVGAVKE
ncbi:carbohydrate ABC transporter permease [Ruoffia tabacinasalis]|uniref:Carbohydrate ABC transporter permease n=1 Tax=Ruoffia tabacinasalis TaxID=87458 RepID=A0A5R9EN29_9LACT|nr:carbohydrate ABC transporter permease [Ruoffia tabacinasalis]TLQ49014.1 carbohydrate ABC transporter permease [Ruoffia tabacinasalis]